MKGYALFAHPFILTCEVLPVRRRSVSGALAEAPYVRNMDHVAPGWLEISAIAAGLNALLMVAGCARLVEGSIKRFLN